MFQEVPYIFQSSKVWLEAVCANLACRILAISFLWSKLTGWPQPDGTDDDEGNVWNRRKRTWKQWKPLIFWSFFALPPPQEYLQATRGLQVGPCVFLWALLWKPLWEALSRRPLKMEVFFPFFPSPRPPQACSEAPMWCLTFRKLDLKGKMGTCDQHVVCK